MTKRRPLFTMELEVDEMQTEKIQIFSTMEIKLKVSQFFKSYSINDPVFKNKIMNRITSFFDQLKEKKMYSNPLKSNEMQLKSSEKSELDLTIAMHLSFLS
jgi:hypothetical protein